LTPSLLFIAGFEKALNRYLRLDADGLSKVAALSGKVIAVEPSGLGLTLYFLPGPNGIQVVDTYGGPPDALIRGAPYSLFRQAWRGAKQAPEDVDIEGDMHLGKDFQQLLTGIDIDWEEQLSRLLGDPAAHQVGNVAAIIGAWGRKTVDTLFQNAAEYLQQEALDLPPGGSVEQFMDAVDRVRADTDRLEARIRRLREL
jgi:ubiquinone biosynthesis protein UbiJ